MSRSIRQPPTAKRQIGFTLFEVLIAVAILAIALLAIYSAVSSSINTDARLKGKIAAHDIALSVISNLEIGILQPSDNQRGVENVFGQNWQWQVKSVNSQPGYRVVQVRVSNKVDPSLSDQLEAWVPASSQ